jgi:lipopolysaccharide/colanic/teichoic acid biosynthesis glycosyltransferase
MRRLGDVVIAILLLAITSPLWLLIALIIRWDGPGAVFDKRECIGCGGCRYWRLSFRTTVHDPKVSAPDWADRVTKVGRFLRYIRLDALPQLINVLRGELTIIENGPFRIQL